MIKHVSVFLYPFVDCSPFVAIDRGERYKFYDLTPASAYRLVRVLRKLAGEFRVSGQGWDWRPAGA